jgi:carboxymethylenebutenolidase
VLGLYAGDDARVNQTVPPAQAELGRLGRTYDVHFFDASGHGFLRQQDGRDGANMAATRQAWPRTVTFLRQHLEGGGGTTASR